MKETTIVKIYMSSLLVLLILGAYLEQPYFVATIITLLVVKQLGRIITALQNTGDKQ
jgi:hypothetical protein